ncbi:MAG: hypothetical protein IIW20_05540 [Clostridia bacterium]|nr:hypothetical protein [Clostridia bacterium]
MRNSCKNTGITVSAFGLGILVAFFLPECVLVVIEACVIILAGFFFMKG